LEYRRIEYVEFSSAVHKLETARFDLSKNKPQHLRKPRAEFSVREFSGRIVAIDLEKMVARIRVSQANEPRTFTFREQHMLAMRQALGREECAVSLRQTPGDKWELQDIR
jgi:hypothetical protein